MSEQKFPTGWDERRVQALLAELDARTEEEWIAGDEAAATESDDQAVITIPATLLPEVRRLLAAHKTAQPVAAPRHRPCDSRPRGFPIVLGANRWS